MVNRDEQTTHSMMTMIPKDLFSGWVPSPTCTCWLKPASYPFFRWIHAVSKPCEPHKQWVFWNRFVVFLHVFYHLLPPNKTSAIGDSIEGLEQSSPRLPDEVWNQRGRAGTVVWLRWVQPGDEMRIEWELNYHNLAANLMGYIWHRISNNSLKLIGV